MLAMNKISRQLIALVFVALAVFGVGVAGLIGFQSYSDLEDIAFERVEGAASLFASEYEAMINRAYNSLADIESNQNVSEQLTLLNNYGPLYAEDPNQINKPISDAETSFYFQSQLKLARGLIHLLPLNDLNQLAIYHTDPFDQFDNSRPLPSLIVDHEFIWFYRYLNKSATPDVKVYRIPIMKINYEGDFFDVSSIYQETADFFYDAVGVEAVDGIPFDHYRSLRRPLSYSAGQVINLAQDKLNVAIWSPVSVNLVNPETWEESLHYTAIIVGVHRPSRSNLSAVANRLGAEIAIVDDEHVWVSSISNQEAQENLEGNSIIVDQDPYIFSEVEIDLPSDNKNTFKVMALSPTEGLRERTNSLIIRLSIITGVAILFTATAIYILMRRKLKDPLDKLMSGVQSIQEGNMDVQVDITVNNELATLGNSFNKMTEQILQKSKELQQANDTLESKVKARTEDLQNAQQQLILAEKMASLGQLVAGVAHEINTPLGNSITALSFNSDAQKAIQKKFDEKSLTVSDFGQFLENTSESMALMHTNLRKASELVQTFKNVAVNQSVEEVIEFSLKDHIHEVLVTLRPQTKQTQVNIRVDVDDDLSIASFPGAYYHIISNMIVNSLRHAFPDKQGTIQISIHREQDKLHLHYEDDGEGMDEATKNRIFDPFFTTKRGDGGTGLGMYMTYNIVTQRLGGSITVMSEKGKGTQFDIVVPLELPELPEDSDHFSSV